ncbi:7TM chemoreceptor [Ostertagia ostertagi]
MDWMLLLSIIVHTLTNVTGLITNGILIFLVLMKTPRRLTTYSMLILNFGICDFLSCASAFFVQQRIIPGGNALYFFSHGPCKFIGSYACYIGYSIMLHCLSHWLWSLLFSFSYRYYILGHHAPKTSTVVFLVTFCFTNDDVEEVKLSLSKKFTYDMTSACVNGHLDIHNWKVMIAVLHMTLPITPVYIAILILRRLTIAKLRTERVMSENSKHLHAQLLKALTIQACLPIFFLLAVITYVVGQLGIYNHPLLEYSTFALSSFIPMLSPVTSFYFVRPYRVWLRDRFFCVREITRSRSISKITATHTISSETSRANF